MLAAQRCRPTRQWGRACRRPAGLANQHGSHPNPSPLQVYDCWARDIVTVNADNGIFVHKSTGVTITGLSIKQSKRRDPMKPKSIGDGHWGVHTGGWVGCARGGRRQEAGRAFPPGS